jgi:glutamate synthase (NADPH) small chain
MASICPKCHQELEEDAVCCATLEHTWKCAQCGKVTESIVVPYGRCHMCGGTVAIVDPYPVLEGEAARVVEEALRYELEMYQFYRLARGQATDAAQKALFEQMYLKEQDHIAELESRYHIHLPEEALEQPPSAQRFLAAWIFEGIDLKETAASVKPLYDRALMMERRTRDHFAARARELPAGPEREICRELAAEEEEHVSILEGELAQLEVRQAIGR